MDTNFQNLNLFSFLLKCYKEIDEADLSDILLLNKPWNLTKFWRGYSFSFRELVRFLTKNDLIKEFNNKRFISYLLKQIDQAIYSFEEYDTLFSKNDDTVLQSDEYVLIITPNNCIFKQTNKIFGAYGSGDDEEWLRKRRHFDPSKTCYKIGLENLNFVKKSNNFVIKQSFSVLPQVANDLFNNIVNVGFFPFVAVNADGEPLFTTKREFPYFEIFNHKEYVDTYLDYLEKAFKSNARIIILPEISIPTKDTTYITNVLMNDKIDVDKLIVAGSNWDNKTNTCYVFDDKGKLLLGQKKYNPYIDKFKNIKYFEKLNTPKPFIVNILNVKDFGTIGFPICSDLISSKYIESIYCECDVTNLFVPCMSISTDIYSSLPSLTSNYWISVFVCNASVEKKKIIGFYSLPTKEEETRRAAYSKTIAGTIEKDGIVQGVVKKINLSEIKKC